jgi:site-specific DNA-methyltransferase (adenine-specific)
MVLLVEKFRCISARMLNDDRIRKIVDFEDANEVFPGVDIAVVFATSYGIAIIEAWCEVTNIHNKIETISIRRLNEFKHLFRHGKAISIVRKVLEKKNPK